MNLGKLLSVGKSIFGTGGIVAYRLNRRARLPKFNEGKNPFVHKAPEPPAGSVGGALAARVGAPAAKEPPPYAFKPARTGKRLLASTPVEPVITKPARSGWTARLNPFRAPDPDAAPSPSAVQAELSLDAVKVVHNDLADADVEVVPVKSHADQIVPAPVLPPARQAWEYLGENLLKT